MTRRLPYHEIVNDHSVIPKISRGELPIRPRSQSDPFPTLDTIDEEIWRLLKLCWNFDPERRPSCQQIMGHLGLIDFGQVHSTGGGSHFPEFRNAMRTKADVS